MKIAFHFHGSHPELGFEYGLAALRLVSSALLGQQRAEVTSKIFVGDLLFRDIDMSRDGRQRRSGDIVKFWLHPHNPVWTRFLEERLIAARGDVYAICLESVDQATAEGLHNCLVDAAPYLGAMEVDDGYFLHWDLYSQSLSPLLRVLGGGANVFWDGFSEDDKDPGLLEELRSLGFNPVSWESLNGRFSIFDSSYHDFKARSTRCGMEAGLWPVARIHR